MPGVVLLVDDAVLVCEAIEYLLTAAGYRVIAVPDSRRALDTLAEQHIDTAIVDMQLQGESGVALLASIHEQRPEVKTILMSGSFEQSATAPSQAMSVADAVLAKPVDLSALRETLGRLMGKSRPAEGEG